MNDTTAASPPYPLPPQTRTASGDVRRVGVELEMAHVGIEVLADTVRERFGGAVERETDYEYRVSATDDGDWKVELDWAFLREWARAEHRPLPVLDDVVGVLEDLLRRGSEHFVPYEIVSPPLPMDRLGSVDALIGDLRARDARGTSYGLNYAFGMQLNVELPALDADTILDYLKAFACLHDWLRKRAHVDLTRRLTAFADPFPADYVRRLVHPDYRPGETEMIRDYLAANPTRNRALDLLPLFRHLQAETVLEVVNDDRVKPRPALHYRLPDCKIDLPDWDLRPTWEDWLVLEGLAADRAALDDLGHRYCDYLAGPLAGIFTVGWFGQTQTWLRQWQDR